MSQEQPADDNKKENDINGVEKDQPKVDEPTVLQLKTVDPQILKARQRINRAILVVLLLLSFIVFLPILKLFLVPIVVAATFTAIFYPLFAFFQKLFRKHKPISAFFCCLTILIGLLVPLYFILYLISLQLIQLYNMAQPLLSILMNKETSQGLIDRLPIKNLLDMLPIEIKSFDWDAIFNQFFSITGKFGATIINKMSTGLLSLVLNAFIMLFTMFYFFMDGDRIISRLRYLSPLRREYEDLIIKRFLLISRSSIRGTLVIGLAQGTVGSIALLIFGVKSWLLWGFIMIGMSVIPMAGAWMVLIPAGIIQIIFGNTWQGVGIILTSIFVVSSIDNIIRPRLVGQGARMHDLLIFFSTLGGIALLGPLGFIVGPAMAALVLAVLDIYGMEFKPMLDDLELESHQEK